jgi:hypothetical protein
MPIYTLCGRDTLTLDGRNITNFADGTVISLEHPNETTTVTSGKGGNTIYASNEAGQNANLTLRILKGSDDDGWLNGRQIAQHQSLSDFILITGTLVRRFGSGIVGGETGREVYTLEGGVFVTIPATSVDTTGTQDQGVSIYQIRFARAPRTEG